MGICSEMRPAPQARDGDTDDEMVAALLDDLKVRKDYRKGWHETCRNRDDIAQLKAKM